MGLLPQSRWPRTVVWTSSGASDPLGLVRQWSAPRDDGRRLEATALDLATAR
jgi:hypothetical protein